jgi:gliding motility-associated-like protein
MLVFTCMVSYVNAQTNTKYHKSLIVAHKKTNQGGNLRTTSTPPIYCPNGPVMFYANDTNNFSIGSATGVTLTCSSIPFYINADNSGDVVTPCVMSEYTSSDVFLPNNGNENFYEGGVYTGCVGPSASCYFPIGGGISFFGGSSWGVQDIFSDPSKQHNYQFCYQGTPTAVTKIQLQDCWSGDSLSPTNTFGTMSSNPCFTDSVLANTDIGTALYSIAPVSGSVALTDYHNGKAYIDPSLLSAGNYTVTYSFKPPAKDSCPTITGTYTFSVASISISVNSATVCAGSAATLTASGPASTTYSWSPATNLSATTGTTVTATPSVTSIYTVTGKMGSCSGTATSTVTVNATPTLTVNSPTICAGSTATLTASGASTYTWSPASGLSTTTGSTVTTNTLSTNTIYTVNATSLGCSAKATTTVTVNNAPIISVNTATICIGNTATLTASGATTYTWSTTATSVSITPSPTTTTVYTVTGTSSGCSSVKTTTVTVNSLPTITVNSATICAASTTTLTASGASTYTWNTGTINASITPSPTTTTIYTVTGTNANSCRNMATSTVTVNQPPVISVSSTTICVGLTTTLTASGATTYTWNTGVMNANITPSPTTTTVYTVNGTTNGCSSSKTVTVTVNSLPTVSVNSATMCIGNTATLTANGASTYTWNTTATTPVINPSPTITTIYTVTGTDIHACKNSATSTVTVNALPIISVNSATICAGNTTTLTASGANTYTWSTTSTTPTISPSPTTTTVYTVTGTNANACKNSATSTVTVNALPMVSVNSATICEGNSTTLTASGANTYTWNTGTINASITPSPTTTTVYTVMGTNANGCKNSVTSTITVNFLPVISVSWATICIGGSATLIASGANTYTWNTGVITPTITTSPNTTTFYTVTGTDIHACKNSATSTVTVNPLPIISVNSTTICMGGTATLVANGASTYTWNTGSTGATITPSPTVATVYTVTGTNIYACQNSATSTVSIKSLPIVTPTVNEVCVGQTIHLMSNSVAGSLYTWSGPNGYISSVQNPTITNATIVNSGIYTLTISSGGCSASSTVSAVVDIMPTIANAGLDTISYNSSLSMSGNVPIVGMGTWSVITGSGNISNSNQSNTQVTNLQSGQNILQWTISNGACPVSYDDVIIVIKDLTIPNGFSPNGDGVNDNFEINGLGDYTNVKINVFNRWGNLVYDSDDYKNNWNGKNMSGEDLSDDTYFYTLEIPKRNTIKGYVVIKRK